MMGPEMMAGYQQPQDQQADMMAAGDQPQAYKLMQQQKLANALRSGGMLRQPAGTQAGNVYVANPLGAISNALGAYVGHKQQGEVDAGMAQMAQQRNQARLAMADKIQMALRRPYPDAGTVLPPDGMEDR